MRRALALTRPTLSCLCLTLAACSGGGTNGTTGHGGAGTSSGGSSGSSGGGASTTSGGSSGSSGDGASGGSTSGGSSGGLADAGPADAGSADAGATDAGDSWVSWASPDFFQTYCVSCHAPGGQGDPAGSGLDFTQYANVVANAATIRCGVAATQDPSWSCAVPAEQFPIGNGPHPSAAERDRLVGWIDAGLPEGP